MDLGNAATWLAPLVALTIGTVTALLTGINLVVSKENKVSEFRQDWINEQRKDLAAALAAAQAYRGAKDDKRVEQLLAFDAAQARVELRENPNKEEWTDVRAALAQLRSDLLDGTLDDAKLAKHRDAVFQHGRPPLKKNWTVVKDGETWFKSFKIAYATVISIFILIAAGWMIATAFQMRGTPTQPVHKLKTGKPTLPAPSPQLPASPATR
ncbi:hypothetical protein [Sphingomonas sp. GM_Shp_1]|uniref:hypothetical protein n=1 Tax=Sphingomonas sp. GM_Shp_1 TaxID=2937381 RepID=UPI00226B0B8C|nr:hypothetical protein [Sphingomonas sp. GM_Shp_1]